MRSDAKEKIVKDLIRLLTSAFPSGQIELRPVAGNTPLVICDIQDTAPAYHRITISVRGTYCVVMFQRGHFKNENLGHHWELDHWDELDLYTAQSHEDMIGWVSWATTYIGLPFYDPGLSGQIHLLPHLARFCWANGGIDLRVKGSFRFNLMGATWSNPLDASCVLDIKFTRPGELDNPLGQVTTQDTPLPNPGAMIPPSVITRLEEDARILYEHLNPTESGQGLRVPQPTPEILRNMGDAIARHHMDRPMSRLVSVTAHPTFTQGLFRLMQGIPNRNGGGNILDFTDMSNHVKLNSNPSMRPDIVDMTFADGTSITYQVGRGVVKSQDN